MLSLFQKTSVSKLILLLGLLLSAAAHGDSDDEMSIQRLTWAGVKIVAGNTTVLIDAVGTDLWDGNAPGGLVPVEVETSRSYALITHSHNDHFDAETLKSVLGERGYVIVHESEAAYLASRGLRVIPARNWEPVERGGFQFTALPAMDGFGSHQVSWLITKDGKRFFHGGDTLWHGAWKKIGDQYGGIDMAFLPINAAVVESDPQIDTPAVMTPSQAVDAALMLQAAEVVPIHYGLNDPPYYIEPANVLTQFSTIAAQKGVSVKIMQPGDEVKIK
jgi:L-ascorbate metabolism protein UlaG (beta-lactamase superfamily)